MAEAKHYLDTTGVGVLWSKIKTTMPKKVSDLQNDSNFETNTIVSVSVNTSAVAADSNRNVNITVPTKTSDIANDSDYQNEDEVKALIATALDDITSIEYRVLDVDENLPTTGEAGVIYLKPHVHEEEVDSYDEFIWAGSRYEKLGNTDIDLSGYVQDTDIGAITEAELNKILV